MEQQVEKLKLNVTNIKNSLFSNNKELKKIEKDKTNLFSRLDKKRTLREEEGRLESKNLGIGSGFSKIASTITSPVKGIFDRILEFFGLIAAGILLQNLPIILKQVEDFFNSDFIKGVGNVLGFIGNGILQLAQFVGLFPKSEQDKIKKDADETNKIIDEDIKNADRSERDIINLEKLLGQSVEDNEPEQSIESPQSEPDRTVTPKEPKEPSDTQKPESTQPITAKNPVQSFNRGGTVKSTPEKLSERQAYQPQKSRQSPEGKKAQRDANNGFINFPIAVDKIIDVTKEHEKNILLYADVLKKDRGLRSGITTTSPDPNGGNDGNDGSPHQGPGATPGNADPTAGRIFGRVGSTGSSTGPHIHIETGDGYLPHNDAGKPIPKNVLDNIIVGGRPLSEYRWTSGLGFRTHPVTGEYKEHFGYDYPINKGTPIQLKGGLEYINFHDAGSRGYGKSIMIKDANGNEYILGHLSTGPDPAGSVPITPRRQVPLASPGYGRGGPSLGPLNSSGNQSVFIYAVQPVETYVPFPYPMPVETPVASSSPTPQLSSIWRG